MDFWQVLPAAFALMLIIEGIVPFVNPHGWRRYVGQLAQASERTVRLTGLVMMIAGVLALYWVNPG